MVADPRNDFIDQINLATSRVRLEPKIMFVCGGKVDATTMTNHSVRNMVMNLSADLDTENLELILAEKFKDWHRGYGNLSDFENDIAFLSSQVIIILESEGALTEFGLFFANENIRKKLIVIIHSEFHESDSFIKLGLLNPLEEKDTETVKVYNIDHRDIENVNKDDVKDIVIDIIEHSERTDKSEKFNSQNRGHQIFLIFQLIDLFHALTLKEIGDYLVSLGINITNREIKSAIFILVEFEFLAVKKNSSTNFYIVPDGRSDRIEIKFHQTVKGRSDASSVKIATREYYSKTAKKDQTNRRRVKVLFQPENEDLL